MKPNDLLSGIVYFFNDLIGAVIPGILVIIGLIAIDCLPSLLVNSYSELDASFQGLLVILIAYAIGHGLLGFHRILITCVSVFTIILKKIKCNFAIDEGNKRDSSYSLFKDIVNMRIKNELENSDCYRFDFNNLRSMAMTISKEAAELARRFMFISLFCYGVSMSILFIGFLDVFYKFSFVKLGIYFLVFIVFYIRGRDFQMRAKNTPFPVAVAEILSEKVKTKDEE